jgi:hypothetical protein
VIGLTKSFDLREFEEIVERAIRRARSEELRLIGDDDWRYTAKGS